MLYFKGEKSKSLRILSHQEDGAYCSQSLPLSIDKSWRQVKEIKVAVIAKRYGQIPAVLDCYTPPHHMFPYYHLCIS